MVRLFLLVFPILAIALPSTARAQATEPRSGEEIYQLFCAACHGIQHEGGKAQSLIKETWLYGSVPNAIRENIKNGILAVGMPPFGAAFTPN